MQKPGWVKTGWCEGGDDSRGETIERQSKQNGRYNESGAINIQLRGRGVEARWEAEIGRIILGR